MAAFCKGYCVFLNYCRTICLESSLNSLRSPICLSPSIFRSTLSITCTFQAVAAVLNLCANISVSYTDNDVKHTAGKSEESSNACS